MTVELLGMAEAAEIVGISKSNFTSHRQKFSAEGQCPEPTAQLTCGPIWAGKDAVALKRWAKEWGKTRTTRAPRRSSDVIAAEKAAKAAAPAKKAVAKFPGKKIAVKRLPAPAKKVAKKTGAFSKIKL